MKSFSNWIVVSAGLFAVLSLGSCGVFRKGCKCPKFSKVAEI